MFHSNHGYCRSTQNNNLIIKNIFMYEIHSNLRCSFFMSIYSWVYPYSTMDFASFSNKVEQLQQYSSSSSKHICSLQRGLM